MQVSTNHELSMPGPRQGYSLIVCVVVSTSSTADHIQTFHNIFQLQMMTSPSKMLPIVEFNGDKAVFNDHHIEAVLKSVKELPVIVVSVAGLFRSGKSCLINLMVTYLRHLQNVSFPI